MKKISIISVVRNDNYGELQVDRTIAFLKSLNNIPNKERYEIIFVEWNPPQDELKFYDRYYDYLPKNITVKIVDVSNIAHESIYNPSGLPLFEYYGKNVGARNSSGDFLVFTNPDNIFYPQTWIDIESNLSDEHFMRLCRADVKLVDANIIYETNGIDTIERLMTNIFHFYEPPAHPNNDSEFFKNLTESFIWDINHEGASGDFFGVSKKNFYKFKGYCEYWTYGRYDGLICRDSKQIGLLQLILPKYSVHIDHSRPHLGRKQGTDENVKNTNNDNWGLVNVDGISVKEYNIK